MLVHRLKVTGLLSFGPEGIDLPLGPLNVLIGPNGSGKSNLLEVLALLRATPNNLPGPVMTEEGGGIEEWLWKAPAGDGPTNAVSAATINAVVQEPPRGRMRLRHVLEIIRHGGRFEVTDERIENERPHPSKPDTFFFYRYQQGYPVLREQGERSLQRENVNPEQSILSQVKDPERYPVLGWLQEQYEKVRLYKDWTVGPSSPARRKQSSYGRSDILHDDLTNLNLVLSNILPRIGSRLNAALRQLYEGIDDIYIRVRDGGLNLSLKETGERLIPASRLSDGTLRYLMLLTVLLHPDPPPLVAIEEPELGLHPDLIPEIGELLIAASERMQLVVTTHSRMLVDALTEHPSSVVVCTKENGESHFERLDEEHLKQWLKDYDASATLGDLWSSGDIGGNRW